KRRTGLQARSQIGRAWRPDLHYRSRSSRVRERNPPQEVAHASIFRGRQHKMPVVGHSLVSQNPAGVTRQSLGEDLLEGFVVLRIVEIGRPALPRFKA
ncbi:MAG: hypothetical protein RLY70_2894, partial [Planctomycetota bacterium]